MTKPDWCPTDVWASADDAAASFCGTGLTRIIARAILAERERALKEAAGVAYDLKETYALSEGWSALSAAVKAIRALKETP